MVLQFLNKLTRVAAVAVLALILCAPTVVMAQEASNLSEERLNEIREGCNSAKVGLQQLQKRDAVSRINRGRAYDQVMTQISAFNSRLAYNNVSLPGLINISKELQAHVDAFRSISDKDYLEHLSSASKADCRAKPAEFYALIVKARGDRDKVAEEVVKIDNLISRYREELVRYQNTLPETPKETSQ